MSSVDDFNTGAGIDLNANAYEHQQRASRGQQLTEDYADKGFIAYRLRFNMQISSDLTYFG